MKGSTSALWDDACLCACLCVLAPGHLGGLSLRAGAGEVRDQWLRGLTRLLPAGMPMRRIPVGVSDSRLLGGLDLCATLSTGRAVGQRGLLHEASGGLVVLAMAERLPTAAAARI